MHCLFKSPAFNIWYARMDQTISTEKASPSRIDGFFQEIGAFDTLFLILEIVGTALFIAIIVELAWGIASGKRRTWETLKEPLVNLTFLFGTKLVELTNVFGLIVAGTFLFGMDHSLFNIPMNWMTWIGCMIMVDFTYYWMHRCEHRVRLFWTTHSVHHSSEEYEFSTALRVFWLLDFVMWIFFMPLMFIGFSGIQVSACMGVLFTYAFWIHTEHINRIPYFELVFNTPSFHRVHHGRNRQYIDKNYAGILVIWDKMFGTYEPEVEKVRYGLTKAINTGNPLLVGFHEFIVLGRDLKNADGFKNRFLTLFKGPGWKPKSS